MIQMIIVANPASMEQKIFNYVQRKATKLFRTQNGNDLKAIFDKTGFWFDEQTEIIYNQIKNIPHIYVAFTRNKNGHYYIGISNQKGGRWKRSHAYHLGTLSYHLLDTIQADDQNHQHWIDNWMDAETVELNIDIKTIMLKEQVYIAFIPFDFYSDLKNWRHNPPSKIIINEINKKVERDLIKFYSERFDLLNIQHG